MLFFIGKREEIYPKKSPRPQKMTVCPSALQDLCVKSEANGNECWSLSEVTQALTLLAHFHSFSSFVLGCGLMDHPSDEDKKEEKEEEVPATVDDKVPLILEKMETLGAQEEEQLEVEELNRRFEKIEKSQTQDIPLLEPPNSHLKSRSHTPDLETPVMDPAKYTQDLSEFQYVDFVKREDSSSYPTLRTHVRLLKDCFLLFVKRNFFFATQRI